MDPASQLLVEVTAPAQVAATIDQLVADQVASKLTAQDPTLWGPEAEDEASIRLAWTTLAQTSQRLVPQILTLRQELADDGIDRVVLVGMGGSSLAPEVICANAGVELVVLDTTDAAQTRAALVELERTVVVVSSKSGTTVEPTSLRAIFTAAFTEAGLDPARHFVVVTDPDSELDQLASQQQYRAVFRANPQVGGRYSALTAFGLVPAGLAGVDVDELLAQAGAVAHLLAADEPTNPALQLGALLGAAHEAGSEKVVLAAEDGALVGFGDWAEQLIAESTGKGGRGLLPVVVESVDAPGFIDAGEDAVTISIGGGQPPKSASGFSASVTGSLGAQFLLWEYAIAVAGRVVGINPFDQPNVEAAKAAARTLLADPSSSQTDGLGLRLGEVEVSAANFTVPEGADLAGVIAAFFAAAPTDGYIAIQAYLDRLGDTAARLRAAVASRTGHQTTFGWGPRFLHSTGQYHKGGHPNGIFWQITAEPGVEDLAIPGEAFSLSQLQRAQARGDAVVLADQGRPVLQMHLWDRAVGLAQIAAAVGELA